MLCNINQKTEGLLPDIKNDGCLFLCFAYASPMSFADRNGVIALNHLWNLAREKGIINLSNEVTSHTKLAREIFALPVKYDDKHHGAEEEIPPSVHFAFGQFEWKYRHFVVVNRKKEVVFDPLIISNSVKYGKLISMRWYYAD